MLPLKVPSSASSCMCTLQMRLLLPCQFDMDVVHAVRYNIASCNSQAQTAIRTHRTMHSMAASTMLRSGESPRLYHKHPMS
jgi:hypothetical protein